MAPALVLFAVAVIYMTNWFLSQQFTETTRSRAELRLAFYSGNIVSELQRNSVVPLLLSKDPELIRALDTSNFAQTSARLITFQSEIGAASIQLMDAQGRVVAATNRNVLGSSARESPYFIAAQRSKETLFSADPSVGGGYAFTYARAVTADNRLLGVVVVAVDLMKFERSWAGFSDAVLVTDSQGQIILATEPLWRGRTLDDALSVQSPPSAIERALRLTADWARDQPDTYVDGEAVLRNDARIPFRGWRIVSFTKFASVRERVNAILALEIMAFAILLAGTFYVLSRRALSRSNFFQRESAGLRRLNAQLQREIAERQKAEKSLAVAEQTLAQSSKLAVLGEMSASVSHELNQPLAAMKTYLAGARLLLQRRRPDEALASFQRIDDLIERMGAITRQLKSFARKGGEAFEPVDLRSCVSGALAMMEPQLKTRAVKITRSLPRHAVMVQADRIRLEQVIINLLRNALDAIQNHRAPQIDITLTQDPAPGPFDRQTVVLCVRDNGDGISDLDNLFEPFFTTKAPGEGVGLGLAISSGIVKDLGGRLTARNAAEGGAIFEVALPILADVTAAAQ